MASETGLVPHNMRLGNEARGSTALSRLDPIDINVDAPDKQQQDVKPNYTRVESPDGSVVIHLERSFTPKADRDESDFYRNLADELPETVLNGIAAQLCRDIQADDDSRADWLEIRSQGITMLGLKIEKPRSGVDTGAPLEGMSTVRHPLLLEAVLRFQANARGELLPSNGPCKVRNDGFGTVQKTKSAMRLEKAFNHYLTNIAKEYYPDTDRMLLYTGFGGDGFKKVYKCPLKRRPVSLSVDAKDLIVSNTAVSLSDAGRITHEISMRPSMVRRMQLAGAYRDIELQDPHFEANPVDRKVDDVQGTSRPVDPRNMDRTVWESYCELDIPGFEHEDEDGEVTGLAIPYKVSIDKVSQQILEVRRNYREDDLLCMPIQVFVQYQFVPGLGFYSIGLLNILGNATQALTAAWRLMLDAGMFSNFPGFLFATDGANRDRTNDMRVSPGSGRGIATGGEPIGNMVMPLPYKDVSASLIQLTTHVEEVSQRVGGTAEIKVGESKADAPVGTTLALIEQAAIIVDAVHKRLHAAQAEELQLLKDLFAEDPAALWRHARGRARDPWMDEELKQALEDNDLVPAADPNTPSQMHRLMKAMALKQIQMLNPQLYDPVEVDTRCLMMLGIDDIPALFTKNPPQKEQEQPDPNKVMELMLKAKIGDQQAAQKMRELQAKLGIELEKQKGREKDRDAKIEIEKIKAWIEVLNLATTLSIHPENEGVAARALKTPTSKSANGSKSKPKAKAKFAGGAVR